MRRQSSKTSLSDERIEQTTDEGFRIKTLDGGYGWIVVLGSFLAHFVIDKGFMRSGGVIYLQLRDRFDESAASTAWAISLAVTIRMLFGPLASALCNRLSCRTVVMAGGVLLCAGVLISGFTPNLAFLFFSYSLVGGIGRAFIYTPAVVIVALYFEKRRGTAAGIANAGIGSGTFVAPPIVEIIFQNFGFTGAHILMAAFGLQACVFGALFRPVSKQIRLSNRRPHEINIEVMEPTSSGSKSNRDDDCDFANKDLLNCPLFTKSHVEENAVTKSLPDLLQGNEKFTNTLAKSHILHGASSEVINFTGSIKNTWQPNHNSHNDISAHVSDKANLRPKLLDVSLLQNIQFLTFCIGIGLYTLSFQASYVFLPPLAIQNGQSDIEATYVVSIAGALETLGSILSGFVLDLPVIKPHRLLIYNIVLFILGILTFIIPFLRVFGWLSFTCGLYGFLLGSGLAQKATLVVDILGVEHLVSSLGILVCFQGLGVLFGPPLSGFLKDYYGLYDPGFYCGGVAMIASGVIQGVGGMITAYNNNRRKP